MKRNLILGILLLGLWGCGSPTPEAPAEQPAEQPAARSETFQTIQPKDIQANPIELIGQGWMLITAGTEASYNTMTASWGSLGELWGRPISTCYINPTRYTYEFMQKAEYYTLCFFDPEYREALQYCGTHSGRDAEGKNKAEAAGLTPAYTANGAVYFKEAYLVLECKKLYSDQFRPADFHADVVMGSGENQSVYNKGDQMHRFYIGEIVEARMR